MGKTEVFNVEFITRFYYQWSDTCESFTAKFINTNNNRASLASYLFGH